jgi:branched-chain amino acid aminotransferase
MMININGSNSLSSDNLLFNNRAFLYGDGVYETIKVINKKVLFLEEHYFRLMASMRIVRMEIPMNFTMEFFEEQILNIISANNYENAVRIRITVYRNPGGKYLPDTKTVSYIIKAEPIENKSYSIGKGNYEVDIYKDFHISNQLLSTIKTTNKLINVLGSIYANENGLQNCFLINENKNIIEALHGNIFMLWNNKLITPPISEGCINGIMRKQILGLAKKIKDIEVTEEKISPFDLQKADELFITNVIVGIQPITKYRKKEYNTIFSNMLMGKLNEMVSEI